MYYLARAARELDCAHEIKQTGGAPFKAILKALLSTGREPHRIPQTFNGSKSEEDKKKYTKDLSDMLLIKARRA